MLGFGVLGQFALGQFNAADTSSPGLPTGHTSGGWDPYRYKSRGKRRKNPEDVERFLTETEELQAQMPLQVAAQREAARRAAEAYLANEAQASEAELRAALSQINEFYRLLRAEIQRRDDGDDELLLLLSS